MKIVTYLLTVLLIVILGAAAYFYLYTFKPMAAVTAEYERVKIRLPELEKAKAELKKLQERERQETAWINPVIDAINTVFADEIKSGKMEALTAGNAVVINITEQLLYMPGSYTFARESRPMLIKLSTLLSSSIAKGKELSIGNTTEGVSAQGRGRRRIPAKDARTLAADRSAELVKYLEKNGVNRDALIAAAYSAKQPEVGLRIKDRKTVIIIEPPIVAPPPAASQGKAPVQAPAKPAAETPEAMTQPAAQPKPIQPAQPKPQ